MGSRAAWRGSRVRAVVIAAMVVVPLGLPVAVPVTPAHAQTNATCLDVKNTRSDQITVTVVGFDENNSYWVFGAGESAVLVNDNGPLRGSTFTIRLYSGEGINSSRQLTGSNKYVSWDYDASVTDNGKCSDGAWVATLHD
ncbi:MAG TPA: hypothetical protein VFL28_05105 [bacterium]|nr:hypothetical protein [bacterium]